MGITRAVVLARGLGTRMREPDAAARLSEGQRRAADAGIKMMIPVHGRPFLDYVLTTVADAGITDVALIVAPDHEVVREHYRVHPPERVALSFVVQPEPRGTANAVNEAQRWTAGEPFLAMNADNLYPVPALHALAALDEPGLCGFDREDLVRTSNIPPERVLSFALVEVDDEGYLTAIVEKPGDLPPEGGNHRMPPEGGNYRSPGQGAPSPGIPAASAEGPSPGNPVVSAFRRKKDLLVSMNLWRFDARIFDACRDVPRSARGELELPEAVALAMRRGVRFKTISARGPVLDLSRRGDAADVERRLAGLAPHP
jgi:glucose-1-phosphate thymidylyltransferase